MGLFDIFKSNPLPVDKVFGELKSLKGAFLTCRPMFTPLQKNVEVLIMTSGNIPTDEQRSFYTYIQNNYLDYKIKMVPIIEDTFQNAFEGFKIKDFDKEFKLVALIVPDFTKKPLEWHFSFESEHEPNHIYSVEFIDHQPSHLQIDG